MQSEDMERSRGLNCLILECMQGTYMTDKSKQKSMHQWGSDDTVRPDGVKVKALIEDMIKEIVEAYGQTAVLAKRVGF